MVVCSIWHGKAIVFSIRKLVIVEFSFHRLALHGRLQRFIESVIRYQHKYEMRENILAFYLASKPV